MVCYNVYIDLVDTNTLLEIGFRRTSSFLTLENLTVQKQMCVKYFLSGSLSSTIADPFILNICNCENFREPNGLASFLFNSYFSKTLVTRIYVLSVYLI